LYKLDGVNTMLDAIRALQYEGTRADVALNFREQGNEAVREKRWKDAKEFYTKGIAVLTEKEDRWEKPNNMEREEVRLREAKEACYINRALCNLELSALSFPVLLYFCSSRFVLPILITRPMNRELPICQVGLRVHAETQSQEHQGLLSFCTGAFGPRSAL
jgi:hypothetical protein